MGDGAGEEARWIGIMSRVYGFREQRDERFFDNFISAANPGSWLESSETHIWAVVRKEFTVAVFWGDKLPTAFWFEERDYEMTEKDMRTLDAIDRLSNGEFHRLSADWRTWWLADRAKRLKP